MRRVLAACRRPADENERKGEGEREEQKENLQFTLSWEKSEGELGKERQSLAPSKQKESSGKAVHA